MPNPLSLLSSYLFTTTQESKEGRFYIVSDTILQGLSSLLSDAPDSKVLKIYSNVAHALPSDLFAIWLKTSRRELSITQEDLSVKAEISQGDISLLENNKAKSINGYDVFIGEVQKKKITSYISLKLEQI
ncbi:MAG: hypothetical protein ACJAS4_001420 [Bacteriovoracaceae bacterium]